MREREANKGEFDAQKCNGRLQRNWHVWRQLIGGSEREGRGATAANNDVYMRDKQQQRQKLWQTAAKSAREI